MHAGLGMGSADSKIRKASAKTEKKALKTAAKLAKKTVPGVGPAEASVDRSAGPTPGERSAAAAEENVAVNQRRSWVQMIAALLGLATLLVTWLMRPVPSATVEPVGSGLPVTSHDPH